MDVIKALENSVISVFESSGLTVIKYFKKKKFDIVILLDFNLMMATI